MRKLFQGFLGALGEIVDRLERFAESLVDPETRFDPGGGMTRLVVRGHGACGRPEPVDVVAAIKEVILELRDGAVCLPAFRCDPTMPLVLHTGRRAFMDLLRALTTRLPESITRPTTVYLRPHMPFEMSCLGVERHDYLLEPSGAEAGLRKYVQDVVSPYGGIAEVKYRAANHRVIVTSVLAGFPYTDEVAPPESGRVLVLSARSGHARDIQEKAPWVTKVVTKRSFRDAAALLLMQCRVGKPFHVVIVDVQLFAEWVNDPDANSFPIQAAVTNTPIFLLGTTGRSHLIYRGFYDGAIRALTGVTLSRIVRASPHYYLSENQPSTVVHVEPWVWRQQKRAVMADPKVLVVDDSATNCHIVRRILERSGYEVECQSNADEALRRLAEVGFDLIIVDLHMPGIGGLGLLRKYRSSCQGGGVPAIVFTADTSMEASCNSADAGADGYITKPVQRDRLLVMAATLLRFRHVEAHGRPSYGRDGGVNGIQPPLFNTGGAVALADFSGDTQNARQLLDSFRREAEQLANRLSGATVAIDGEEFRDAAQALLALAAGVGAEALMAYCYEAVANPPAAPDCHLSVERLRVLIADTVRAIESRLFPARW